MLLRIALNIFEQNDERDFDSVDLDSRIIEMVIGMNIGYASILMKVEKNPSKRLSAA